MCGEQPALLLGRTSTSCIDCLKKSKWNKRYVPILMQEYTGIQIIKLIRNNEITEFHIKRKETAIIWDKIPGYKEIKKNKDYD